MLPAPDSLPVLWLCGPSGVGKTTAGWGFFSRLTASGLPAGYVDIDHLGIFLPGPPEDPDLHRLKARNLAAVLANFRERGARCVVVSGIVDPVRGVYADELPGTALTVCRLRVDRAELARRFTGRGMRLHQVQVALDDADVMDASGFGDVCIDTTGLAVAEILRQVAARTGDWPGPGRRAAGGRSAQGAGGRRAGRGDIPAPATPGAGGGTAQPLPSRPSPTGATPQPPASMAPAAGAPALWLCGPTGIGKSTIGWQVYQRIRTSVRTAYVELDQLAFLHPAPPDDPVHHRFRASNLVALWHAYRNAGAEALIITGQVEDEATARTYTAVLPHAAVTLCRLRASRTTLNERITSRGGGGSWPAPGDPLKGRPTADLLRIAEEAAAIAAALDRAALGDLCIATDDRTVEESAAAITAAWPAPSYSTTGGDLAGQGRCGDGNGYR